MNVDDLLLDSDYDDAAVAFVKTVNDLLCNQAWVHNEHWRDAFDCFDLKVGYAVPRLAAVILHQQEEIASMKARLDEALNALTVLGRTLSPAPPNTIVGKLEPSHVGERWIVE